MIAVEPLLQPSQSAPTLDHLEGLFALALAALTIGESRVLGLQDDGDTLALIAALRACGADIERLGAGRWSVHGMGLGTLLQPEEALRFAAGGQAGSVMVGLLSGHALNARLVLPVVLDGMFLASLKRAGARIASDSHSINMQGADIMLPIEARSANETEAVAMVLAALCSPGQSTIEVEGAVAAMIVKVAAAFGVLVERQAGQRGVSLRLIGQQKLGACYHGVGAHKSRDDLHA
jgi:3-phosphoshikimate 1-carboxyvinyltransferase